MILPMSKVEIYGPIWLLQPTLRTLKALGVLQIEDVKKELPVENLHPYRLCLDEEKTVTSLEDSYNRLRNLLANLDKTHVDKRKIKQKMLTLEHYSNEHLIKSSDALLKQIDANVKALIKQKTDLKIELANLKRYKSVFAKIEPLIKKFPRLEGYETLVILIEAKLAAHLLEIEDKLKELTNDQIEVLEKKVDPDTLALALFYSQKFSQQIKAFLWQKQVNEVKLPNFIKPAEQNILAQIEKREQDLEKQLKATEAKLTTLTQEQRENLCAFCSLIKDRLEENQVLAKVGVTDYTFIVSGWLPKKYLPTLEQQLAKNFKQQVIAYETKLSEEEKEEAPVVLQNKPIFRLFEPLINLFETPRYGSIDPTPFLAVFFLLFFGLILGDMGYALIMMAAALILKRKWKQQVGQTIANILLLAGVSSFVFGFIYGEFFYNVPHLLNIVRPVHIFGIEFPFDREKAIKETLIFTIFLGLGHISLGLLLGVINGVKERNSHHALEKAGTLLALMSLTFLIFVFLLNLPPAFKSASIFLLLLALPLLLYGGGLLAVMEIFGVFGNILSYARLMALGLVSVMLAKLANQAGGVAWKQSFILGFTVAALIHLINLVIHLITPTVHALRLNFVEFFSKFMQGSGKAYKPFKKGGIIDA